MPVRRIDHVGGAWPDICADVLTYASGLSVVAVRVHATEIDTLWTQSGPEALMTLRLAVSPSGDVCVVGKSHESGDVVVVRPGRWDAVAQAHGDNPCAVYWADGFIVVFVERAKLGAGPLVRALRVANGEEVWSRKLIPASDGQFSSQGILDLGLDGSPIFTDARRTLNGVAGWTFTKPNVRDGIIVGQTDGAIRVAVAEHVFTALAVPPDGPGRDGTGENPHLSMLIDGRILVSAYTKLGASLAIIDLPYPDHELAPNAGPIVPKPGTPPAPEITITAYPTSVEVHAPARAVAALSSGPAVQVIWLFRLVGDPTWLIAAVNDPSDLDHSFHFAMAGSWEIAVRVEGPGGSNQTGLQRVITVTDPPVDPPHTPMRTDRVWLNPNLQSNIVPFFTDPNQQLIMENVGAFQLSAQHLDGNPMAGPNQFEALKAAGIFRTLKEQGIWFPLGMGSVKEWDPTAEINTANLAKFTQQVADAGGNLSHIAMDEPLTANKKHVHAPLEVIADRVAGFIREAYRLNLKVAWVEAWPEIDLEEQRRFLELLDERDALPHAWQLDVDRRRQTFSAPDLDHIRQTRAQFGIPTSAILAGYAHQTDAEYKDDVLAWARELKAMDFPMDQILLESWVAEGGFQQPQNFEHIDLLNKVVEIFA